MKSFLLNYHLQEPQGDYETVYVNAWLKSGRDPSFKDNYEFVHPSKRGIMFQPGFEGAASVQDIASACLEVLMEHNGDRDKSIPVILDPLTFPDFSYDHVAEFVDYLHSAEKGGYPDLPILVRVLYRQWNGWATKNTMAAARLLQKVTLLSCQPGAKYPTDLTGSPLGTPQWWEYEFGKYLYKEDAEWYVAPVVEDPIVIPDPIIVVPTPSQSPKRYTISLLGGLLRGTIEEIV